MNQINTVFEREKVSLEGTIEEIMNFKPSDAGFLAEVEGSFPGNEIFIRSGHYKTMLKRYLFAGAAFRRGKRVVDSCCGLGWGSYLISKYAGSVFSFDISSAAVDFCSRNWKTENVNWIVGDALDPDLLEDNRFEVAAGMESVEHFTREDGDRYIERIASGLVPGGIFIGTSAFPETRAEAELICARNSQHLYIFTGGEMKNMLNRYFSFSRIINNWMFIARK